MPAKIKIAFVIESFGYGGREKVVLEVINGLDAEKYAVHLIVFSKDKNDMIDALNKNVQFHSLNFNSKDLVTPGIVFKAPAISLKFIKVLKKIQPDIVHTHFLYQLFFIASLSIKLSRIQTKHFHTIHTAGLYYSHQGFKNNITVKTENVSININHAYLVTVSKQLQEICLSKYKKAASEIRCIINGVNQSRFNFHLKNHIKKSDWNLNDDELVVTYVARFDREQKDHLTLLKAWEIVSQKVVKAKLYLPGDGDSKQEAINYVIKNELQHSVVFTGNITNVNELLAVTDIAVFTSRYEGLSVALLEKMFMQIPVVATNIKAFSTIITNNISGYLFEPANFVELSERIIALSENKELRHSIGLAGYNAVKEYTIDSMVKSHDEYYQEVLSA